MSTDTKKLARLVAISGVAANISGKFSRFPKKNHFNITWTEWDEIDTTLLAQRAKIDRLGAERKFLLHRAHEAGHCYFGDDRFTGTSSNALVRFAFGGERPHKNDYPSDVHDYRACQRTVDMLPGHLNTDEVKKLLDEYEVASQSDRDEK